MNTCAPSPPRSVHGQMLSASTQAGFGLRISAPRTHVSTHRPHLPFLPPQVMPRHLLLLSLPFQSRPAINSPCRHRPHQAKPATARQVFGQQPPSRLQRLSRASALQAPTARGSPGSSVRSKAALAGFAAGRTCGDTSTCTQVLTNSGADATILEGWTTTCGTSKGDACPPLSPRVAAPAVVRRTAWRTMWNTPRIGIGTAPVHDHCRRSLARFLQSRAR